MNRRILLVATAVVLAMLGTFAVYSYGKSADKRALAGQDAASVLVVVKRISAGTSWADVLKSSAVQQENMPVSAVPSSAPRSIATAAIGRDAVAQADIAPGQLVLRESFGAATAKTGVLAIPKGLIALSVSLSADADVAGYVSSGSQVVIFVSAKLDSKNPGATASTGDSLMVTRTLIKRASVLATSQAVPTAVAGSKDGGSTAVGTVLLTLAVSQHDAERMILAQKIGELYLGLLSAGSSVGDDGGVTNTGVFNPAPVWVR